MSERWLPVVGFEASYEVSDDGRVRSVDRYVKSPIAKIGTRLVRGRLLRPVLCKNGYHYITLSRAAGDQPKSTVHRLVLEAFVGPSPPSHECCHYDGDKSNNKVTNLRWGTRKENMMDRIRLGEICRGERSGHAKLNRKDIHEIRRKLKRGATVRALGKDFRVSYATISEIGRGETWGWLKEEQ